MKAVSWIFAYLFPLLVLMVGSWALWHSISLLKDAYASSAWLTTSGTITRSDLGSRTEPGKSEDRTSYWPIVEYQFVVEGETFEGSNITLDGTRSGPHIGTGEKQAKEVLARYQMHSGVDVHYDPSDPTASTLETGVAATNLILPVLSIVLMLTGLGWLWFTLTSASSSDKDWSGQERTCPKCGASFTSIQDKGACPDCRHVFYASEAMSMSDRFDVR